MQRMRAISTRFRQHDSPFFKFYFLCAFHATGSTMPLFFNTSVIHCLHVRCIHLTAWQWPLASHSVIFILCRTCHVDECMNLLATWTRHTLGLPITPTTILWKHQHAATFVSALWVRSQVMRWARKIFFGKQWINWAKNKDDGHATLIRTSSCTISSALPTSYVELARHTCMHRSHACVCPYYLVRTLAMWIKPGRNEITK